MSSMHFSLQIPQSKSTTVKCPLQGYWIYGSHAWYYKSGEEIQTRSLQIPVVNLLLLFLLNGQYQTNVLYFQPETSAAQRNFLAQWAVINRNSQWSKSREQCLWRAQYKWHIYFTSSLLKVQGPWWKSGLKVQEPEVREDQGEKRQDHHTNKQTHSNCCCLPAQGQLNYHSSQEQGRLLSTHPLLWSYRQLMTTRKRESVLFKGWASGKSNILQAKQSGLDVSLKRGA